MTEPDATRSRSESRMEVDEAPRSIGRFNLDRLDQEHMNEGLETWTPPEPVPSNQTIIGHYTTGLTPSSTIGSQTGTGTTRLDELQERMQSRALESPAREEQPATWREYQVRSVIIANYKKNTDGAYHRHNREDGRRRNVRGGMPTTMQLGLTTSRSLEHRKVQST